jgi:hypothetical protein
LDTSASRIATATIRPWQHNRLSLNKMPQETGSYISGTPMSIIFPLDCSFLNTQPKDLARYTEEGNCEANPTFEEKNLLRCQQWSIPEQDFFYIKKLRNTHSDIGQNTSDDNTTIENILPC